MDDYIKETPSVLVSYLYNRFHQLEMTAGLRNGKICHVKYPLGIEIIYLPIDYNRFVTLGPFSSEFLSIDKIEGKLISAGLPFTPSLYHFFVKKLPILSIEKEMAAINLLIHFFNIPKDKQNIIPIYLPEENHIFSKANQSVNLAEHQKMLYQYEHSLSIAEAVGEGDYAKCMELLKNTLEYHILQQYSNNEQINETIIACRIGCLFYYSAVKGGVSPLNAENIYTKHVRQMLDSDSSDSIRDLSRSMLRAFCDAVKNCKTANYSSIVQKIINHLSLLGSEELDVKELAQIFKYPAKLLEKEFKAETGFTLKQYHRNLRLQHAETLLTKTSLSINQIALQTGFLDQNYFSRQFKANCKRPLYSLHFPILFSTYVPLITSFHPAV